MRAVLIEGPSVVKLTDVPAPDPRAGEVVLDVALTGICGTDLHIIDGHFPTARYPLIPGHELIGVVAAVGTGVDALAVGARVVVDPGLPCTTCLLCRRGQPNLCERRHAIGISRDGGAAEQVVVPAVNCHLLADGLEAPAAVLAEPLACVLHAFERVAPPLARRVLIYGAGPIGLLAVQVARRLGADVVDVVDPNGDRLAIAGGLGADQTVVPGGIPEGLADWDLVVDASGAPAAISDGLERVQRGGTFLQLGVAPGEAVVPMAPYRVFAREIMIVGSMTTQHTFPGALRLLAGGIIDADAIVEPAMPLSDYQAAVDRVRGGNSLKVVVGSGG